ncbi:Bifunctional oligoribonuclease and PAP phosphatase NrnA [Candidatus Izimaplasma bacterium HR1]|jgi:phosphoesterase RecJ-like protein|uniref:DHH family phosphoesterase n=1 Tax=Candidatus Izimoplasma sp. HR1 TaxID=1541959 RepID=UPI0004F8465C|nr:Bifunctional oligoribonuclease and PAP phosphatase NrnA [Candidatus Izimaplasma bacterium HR1]
MYDIVKSLIHKYNRIIIHRHKNPDGDAYGSQMGLKRLIELNYPDKEVYAVGDENTFNFLGHMDIIPDDYYYGSLAIVVDVCVHRLISDKRYLKADEILVVDHHLNEPDFKCISIIESDHIACAGLLASVFIENDCIFDELAATRFLTGIVTDSGRFVYPKTSAETLETAAYLVRQGADLDWIYDKLYTEELNFKKLKGYFINNFKITENNVAYMKNDKTVKDMFGVTTFTVSRAMVNQMSSIRNINIWANFTEEDDGNVLVELRSGKESIVHIARKYGGGGHALACGCSLSSLDEVEKVLKDLDDFSGGVNNE